MMHFIASHGKQSQLGSQNWFDEKSELSLRMEVRFWGRATRGIFFLSSTIDLEKNPFGTQGKLVSCFSVLLESLRMAEITEL